jgi:hypothetical protein
MPIISRTGRRQFLTRGGQAAVALAALPAVLASQQQAAASEVACPVTLNPSDAACLRQVGPADFEPLVGQYFRAGPPGQAALLHLVAVTRHQPHAANARPEILRSEPFSLLFLMKNDQRLDAAIHEFEHLTWGRIKAYVNEVRADGHAHHVHYEVVFG